jgi:hypothetical protein
MRRVRVAFRQIHNCPAALATEGAPGLMGDGVDRFPLGAAIVMIDPIALIMALYEACSYEI